MGPHMNQPVEAICNQMFDDAWWFKPLRASRKLIGRYSQMGDGIK